ncbi:hypothetical protein K466DRAFT_667768 [Polyporus arcularius HHB13444]|uniref:DUF6534 domain-containing protein n=1 Tax=Polyporus arcularius HHB13444 TaxID=1314778 RepID=A0A5C3NTA1_9APHY|nr:hypothetical protein K466DRAFT_667768 [Polyporus arcularius HHB13444]
MPTIKANSAVLGVCSAINCALFGVFSGQIAFYLRHSYRGDRLFLKCVVLVVLVLNTVRSVLLIYTVWVVFVTAHSQTYDRPDTLPWSTLVQVFLNAVAVLVIQMFYAHRIWKIRRSVRATLALSLLILGTFVAGVALAAYTVLATGVPALYVEVVNIEKSVNVLFAVTDTALTSTLLFVLIRSGTDGPSPLVKRLAFYTLSTGVLTCLSALAGIVLRFMCPHSLISTMLWYLAASLYSTSLMSSLNAREDLRTRYSTSRFSASGTSTMPRFAAPCMQISRISDYGVSITGRPAPRATEVSPVNHSEILVERRCTSYTDEEKPIDGVKHIDGEKQAFADPTLDPDTSVVVMEAGIGSFR